MALIRQRAEPSLIVANYAGWGPGQLDAEIKEGSWLLTPATASLVFGTDDAEGWGVDLPVDQKRARFPELLGIVRKSPTIPR